MESIKLVIYRRSGAVFSENTGLRLMDEALMLVNSEKGDHNCGACAIAYEMRRRGIDVEARLTGRVSGNDFSNFFENISWDGIKGATGAETLASAMETVMSWGEGARGVAKFIWTGGIGSHFFSIEVLNGQVHFVDAQRGIGDVRVYFENMESNAIIFARLDNLMLKDNVNQVVKARED